MSRLEKFDYCRSGELSTYAARWIRQTIKAAVKD